MTWSAPEGPVERIPAPNVGARPVDDLRDVREGAPGSVPGPGTAGDPAPALRAPSYPESSYPESRYPEPGYPDPRYPTSAPASASYGRGYANEAPGVPSQHLAYPVTPYVQAPYSAPRPSSTGTLTLSIVALCLSGGSFLVALIPVLQFVWWMVGIAGIVCGFIALRREPRGRALAITSIVLGFISVFGLLLLIVLALLFFGGIGLLGGFSSY